MGGFLGSAWALGTHGHSILQVEVGEGRREASAGPGCPEAMTPAVSTGHAQVPLQQDSVCCCSFNLVPWCSLEGPSLRQAVCILLGCVRGPHSLTTGGWQLGGMLFHSWFPVLRVFTLETERLGLLSLCGTAACCAHPQDSMQLGCPKVLRL